MFVSGGNRTHENEKEFPKTIFINNKEKLCIGGSSVILPIWHNMMQCRAFNHIHSYECIHAHIGSCRNSSAYFDMYYSTDTHTTHNRNIANSRKSISKAKEEDEQKEEQEEAQVHITELAKRNPGVRCCKVFWCVKPFICFTQNISLCLVVCVCVCLFARTRHCIYVWHLNSHIFDRARDRAKFKPNRCVCFQTNEVE